MRSRPLLPPFLRCGVRRRTRPPSALTMAVSPLASLSNAISTPPPMMTVQDESASGSAVSLPSMARDSSAWRWVSCCSVIATIRSAQSGKASLYFARSPGGGRGPWNDWVIETRSETRSMASEGRFGGCAGSVSTGFVDSFGGWRLGCRRLTFHPHHGVGEILADDVPVAVDRPRIGQIVGGATVVGVEHAKQIEQASGPGPDGRHRKKVVGSHKATRAYQDA